LVRNLSVARTTSKLRLHAQADDVLARFLALGNQREKSLSSETMTKLRLRGQGKRAI
jgi:hypothetical protein